MSCRIEYLVKSTVATLCSPLSRQRHELGATANVCIVRSNFKKILHCAGVLGVSRGGVDRAWTPTAGSIL